MLILLVSCLLLVLALPAFGGHNPVILREQDWTSGNSSGVEMSESGELILASRAGSYVDKGFWESNWITLKSPFTHLVPFWNAITPSDTEISVLVRVKTGNRTARWVKIATWGEGQRLTYSKAVRGLGAKIDTLKVKTGPGEAFKIRVELETERASTTPRVSLLGATSWNEKVERELSGSSRVKGYLTDLDVPEQSQFEEATTEANLICSPAALSMVLQYYGKAVVPLEAAKEVYDHGAGIYGNWAFNTAYASTLGLEAYVRYFPGIKGLREEISEDNPVVVSIAYGEGELTGAPNPSTAGHLIVVRGFEQRNEREYVIVNDPAARKDHLVKRAYELEQFFAAWRGIGYVIHPRE